MHTMGYGVGRNITAYCGPEPLGTRENIRVSTILENYLFICSLLEFSKSVIRSLVS
jgi:hypothetical protein